MFKDAELFNQPLNDWNVSNVTKMPSMFRNTKSFNQDISNWNVAQVTDMYYTFYEAEYSINHSTIECIYNNYSGYVL